MKIKNNLKISLWLFFLIINKISFAAEWGFLWDSSMWKKLKSWDIHMKDIPNMIQYAIDAFMGLAWIIAILFIIIWAYKILFGSLQEDKTKWRDTVIMALSGFALAALSYFIVRLILDNF